MIFWLLVLFTWLFIYIIHTIRDDIHTILLLYQSIIIKFINYSYNLSTGFKPHQFDHQEGSLTHALLGIASEAAGKVCVWGSLFSEHRGICKVRPRWWKYKKLFSCLFVCRFVCWFVFFFFLCVMLLFVWQSLNGLNRWISTRLLWLPAPPCWRLPFVLQRFRGCAVVPLCLCDI